jgi:hypothetical protein
MTACWDTLPMAAHFRGQLWLSFALGKCQTTCGGVLWLLTRGVYGHGVVVQTGPQGLGMSSL